MPLTCNALCQDKKKTIQWSLVSFLAACPGAHGLARKMVTSTDLYKKSSDGGMCYQKGQIKIK